MAYIRIKTNKQGRKYAYQVTAKWDPQRKQARSTSLYLGAVDPDGNIIPKKSSCKTGERTTTPLPTARHLPVLDFGNGYLLHTLLQASKLQIPLQTVIAQAPAIMPLLVHGVCTTAGMQHCSTWLKGNIISRLYPCQALSVQCIRKLLNTLGVASVQDSFFKAYLQGQQPAAGSIFQGAALASTTPQHQPWAREVQSVAHGSTIHCVVDQATEQPLFYRYHPHTLDPVAALQATRASAQAWGVACPFAWLEEGYCTLTQLQRLQKHQIDWLIPLSQENEDYKKVVEDIGGTSATLDNGFLYRGQAFFRAQLALEEHGWQVYAILDPAARTTALQQLLEAGDLKEAETLLKRAGILTLMSAQARTPEACLDAYTMSQVVTEAFTMHKEDADTMQGAGRQQRCGYLFFKFLCFLLNTALKKLLAEEFTVAEALLNTQNLKCTLTHKEVVVQAPTQQQQQIFALCKVILPAKLMC